MICKHVQEHQFVNMLRAAYIKHNCLLRAFLICLSVASLPVACIGLPIFAALFNMIEALAAADLVLTGCIDQSVARRPARTVPSWCSHRIRFKCVALNNDQ